MRPKLLLWFTALCVLVLPLFTGCASSNIVQLKYPLELADTPWCRWPVTVVAFEDQRGVQALGAMDEVTAYQAASSVSDWVTRAVFEEMKARGCECTYVAEAASAGDGFVISGEVLTVRLDKTGINQWENEIRVRIQVAKDGERIYGETYKGYVQRTFVLATDAPEDIMVEGLSDIMRDATEKMIKAMSEDS